MSKPAGRAGDGEEDREHVGGEVHGRVDETRVKVNVGVEVASDEVLVAEGDALKLKGNVQERGFAGDLKDFVGNLLQDGSTRVVGLVDAMTKAEEFGLASLDFLNELGDAIQRPNVLQHSQNSLIRTTMQTSIQGSSRTSDSRVRVNTSGGQLTKGGSGAVQTMLSMQDPDLIQSLDLKGEEKRRENGRWIEREIDE